MIQINQIENRKSVMQTKKFLIQVSLLKADYNAKNTEIEGKIHSITDLATTAALTAVENEIPDVSNLIKKTKKKNYDAKNTRHWI